MVSERSEDIQSLEYQNMMNARTMRKLDILISLNELETEELKDVEKSLRWLNEALKSLKLISELDSEKNDAETYRDAVRTILYNGGWLN